jgi:aspartyl-tRNA(Asn)/glutamyl-tRNA(Gln) amidotransferase subunit A
VDLLNADIASQLGSLRRGELSPVQLCEAWLARVERYDPLLNCFVHLDRDDLLAQARRSEARYLRGEVLGRLDGIPVAIKDVIDVAGMPTTAHSKILLGNQPNQDADCVARLRAEGALIMGKLATHEFARGGPAFDLPFPPARNPWNTAHHPGGSSSGAGAGVAGGLFPLAIGTDTGGSVRNPAAACGVIGFKGGYDRISRNGVFPLSPTLDHVGPLARHVSDIALAWRCLDRQAKDPETARPYDDLRGMRIGYLRDLHLGTPKATDETAQALDAAARTLTDLGAVVEEAQTWPLPFYFDVNRIVLSSEAWHIHQPWLRDRPQDYAAITRRGLLEGAFYSAGDYLEAMRCRKLIRSHVLDLFERYDVLLLASSFTPACAIDDPHEVARTYSQQARVIFNLSGTPAIGMMAGLSKDGLPLSLQFAMADNREHDLLRLAATWERATPWHAMRPPL